MFEHIPAPSYESMNIGVETITRDDVLWGSIIGATLCLGILVIIILRSRI